MISLLKEKRIIIAAAAICIFIVFLVWWFFFRGIGGFKELSKGIYSGNEYSELGKRFEDAGQWKDADQAYLEAIRIDPALQIGAYVALDKIYQKKMSSKEDDMERLYLRGLSQNPQSRALLRGLAQYYERVKNYTAAYQWYSMVIQYYPGDTDSRNAMIRAREKISDTD